MADIIEICRASWNATKQDHQPSYDDLVPAYRDQLSARAEAAIETKTVIGGPFATFEMSVIAHATEPPEPDPLPVPDLLPEVKEELVEEVAAEQEVKRKPRAKKPEVAEKPKVPAKKAAVKQPVKAVKKGAPTKKAAKKR